MDFPNDMELPKFLSCFELVSNSNVDNSNIVQKDYSKKKYYQLNKNITITDREQLGSFLFSNFLGQNLKFNTQLFKTFLSIIPLKKIKLLDLVVHAWLGNNFENKENIFKIIFVLSGCSSFTMNTEYEPSTLLESNEPEIQNQDEEDFDDDDFENVFVSEFVPKFKTTIEASSSLLNSLFLVWLFRSILIKVLFL